MLQTKAITYILEMCTHLLNVQIVINSKKIITLMGLFDIVPCSVSPAFFDGDHCSPMNSLMKAGDSTFYASFVVILYKLLNKHLGRR